MTHKADSISFIGDDFKGMPKIKGKNELNGEMKIQ